MSVLPDAKMVRRDGFALATYVFGAADAPWLTLSNSLGASARMWQPQLPWLARHFRILAYDTRGHGASDAPEGPYGFDDLVGDVVALLDHFGIARTSYIGLSLGGMTGLGLALDHPGRVENLVCCDARADAPGAVAQMWDDRIAAVDRGGMAAIVDSTFDRWFVPSSLNDADLMAGMRSMFLATSPAGYKGCAAALKRLAFLERLGGMRVPTLYVGGTKDGSAAPAVMGEMAERTPGGRYIEIPDAAHISNVDNPAAFNRAVAAFLGIPSD